MLELFIPFLIGRAIGIEPPGTDIAALSEAPGAQVAMEALPETPFREPEPQVPTGRFTTAVEVKPILTMTRPQWIAIREFDGQDLLYFTQMLSWRCGLWEIRYGLNGAPPTISLPLEPCHDQTASPNSITDTTGDYPIYITAPLGSIESVEIEIVYDDGTTDAGVYARQFVLMP